MKTTISEPTLCSMAATIGLMYAKRRQRHAADDEQHAEQKILVDDRARAARELHQERQAAQVVVHQRNRRAVNRHFAAGRAHRDADVAGGQRRARRSRRRRRPRLGSLWLSSARTNSTLFCGRHSPSTSSQPISRATRVATGWRSPEIIAMRRTPLAFNSASDSLRFGAGLVLQADPADALAVARDENQAPAFGLVQVHRFCEILASRRCP